MSDYTFFSKDPGNWGKSYQSLWGCHNICLLLQWFYVAQVTQSDLTSLTLLKAWVDNERFCSDVAFLLVLPKGGIVGERVYGLTMVWVHPYQARVSTLGIATKQFTQLASTGPNWPYVLMQLNGDACHGSLPKEGHLSVLAEEGTSHVPCGRIQQLEVCQLLSSGSQVVYLERLNGCQMLVIMTLPESLSQGVDPSQRQINPLQVDLSQTATEEQEPKAPYPGGGLSPTPAASPTQAFPLKAGQISMTMEVSELLSWAVQDTPGPVSGSSTPKRPGSPALVAMLPLKQEDPTKLVDTSSQVSTPDDAEMNNPTLEEIYISLPPPVETSGPSREAPSVDVAQLQEEANKALDHLLATRSSLDARWRQQVSDFGMVLHLIESETTEAVKAVKALCACTIWDVETCLTALISEAKVWHATCCKEIEDDCSLAVAEAENHYSTTIQ